jgi:hypothetical protein
MRLVQKEVITDAQGRRRVQRRHDQARTPFDRLCETGVLSPAQHQQLTAMRQRTNPRQLRQEIHALIEQILLLPGAVVGETEDIFKTLLSPAEEQRLQRAVGYMGNSDVNSDLATYPQLLLLPPGRNGKTKEPNPLRLKKPG